MKRTTLAGVLLCLAACSAPSSILGSAALQDRLSPVPVHIPKGKCALTLTERGEQSTLEPIFVEILGRREAFIALDTKRHRLTLRRADNKLASGLWLKQDLEGHRLLVSLSLRRMDDGTNDRFQGVLILTKPDQWSNAIPVEGKTSCQKSS